MGMKKVGLSYCIPVIISISQRTTVIGSSGQRMGRKLSGWHYIIPGKSAKSGVSFLKTFKALGILATHSRKILQSG
jgi:hypothetical protein